MAVLTILPEPIANPAIYSTLRNASSINATSKGILADFQSATAETIAEGTAGAGTSTTAAVTAQGLEAFYLAQVAAGLTQDEAIQHLNPAATRKVISFNIVTTGTTTEAQAEAVVLAYTNALGLGEDVIVATVEAAVLALATTTLVTTFELSLDSDPTGETSDLTIGAAEIAFTTAADIDHTAA